MPQTHKTLLKEAQRACGIEDLKTLTRKRMQQRMDAAKSSFAGRVKILKQPREEEEEAR
jgi:uncharacterized protein YmfQ (DUF2313 family)